MPTTQQHKPTAAERTAAAIINIGKWDRQSEGFESFRQIMARANEQRLVEIERILEEVA
jgi:hypothetical protein